MRKARRVQLLVLGQTPPPFVGQMLSIESVVKAIRGEKLPASIMVKLEMVTKESLAGR